MTTPKPLGHYISLPTQAELDAMRGPVEPVAQDLPLNWKTLLAAVVIVAATVAASWFFKYGSGA